MKYIYGLNISGESILKYFLKKHVLFIVWDDKKSKREEIRKKYKNINFINPKKLDWSVVSAAYISPGINLNSKLLIKSKKFKTKLFRDLELYSQLTKNNKIIAVTGTNGKSTSAKLISEMLNLDSLDCYLCGNIGIPLIDAYNYDNNANYHAIELSSYQLESAPSFNSFISILLNISDDHQDRYKNITEYINTKERILNFNKHGYGIISIDDLFCKKIYAKNKKIKKLIPFSINNKINNGISLIDNIIYDYYFENSTYPINHRSKSLQGSFNNQNILVTYIVSKILNIEFNKFLYTINNFKGLPHRLEYVYQNKDYLIINNSKATNFNSSIGSIRIFNNVFLILGGKIKNEDFSIFNQVSKNVLKCFIVGESTEIIFNQVSNYFDSCKCFTINKAVNKIFLDLLKFKSKITILLAPACSSFDQFKDFEERGNYFKKIIMKKVPKE